MKPHCPYCNKPAALVRGVKLYPRRKDLSALKFWACMPCGAWVGCHKGTENPLGRLANAELRLWKQNAHSVFDPLWRSGEMPRHAAYRWLQDAMHLTPAQAHIGLFDVPACKEVVRLRRVMLGKEIV